MSPHPTHRRATRAHVVSALFTLSIALDPAGANAQQPAASVPPRPSNPALIEMQAALDTVMRKRPIDFMAYSKLTESTRARVVDLIARDELRTATDFLAASMLVTDP